MKNLLPLLCLLLLFACKSNYPASTGFNHAASDEKAIAIADEVMQAMGGYKNWQKTRFISWDFFGARTLLWDKKTGWVRIESAKDNFKAIVNIHNNTGQIMIDDVELTHPDSLSKYLTKAKNIWINDSYWLVMPFKLKDSGLTLKYVGTEKTEAGKEADVLSLTFKGVGETPDNKYHVFVDKESRLVSQWTFYTNATDEKPRFSTPWTNYKKYGNILLSDSRGDNYLLADIKVRDQVNPDLFKRFAP